jgi:monoamine oxidase
MVKVDVVIIGAGASGLQCASSLAQAEGKPTFVILEARDRIGGRILTQTESVREVSNNRQVSFTRDLGAAWVHGTGTSHDPVETRNPMMTLLQESTPEGKSVADFHLTPIFEGNAWTRPHTMLHEANRIALFLDGKLIPNDSPQVKTAVQTHYRFEKEVAKYCDHLFEIGEGAKTATTSMEEARALVSTVSYDSDDQDLVVKRLLPFYPFLIEHWKGLSCRELQASLSPDYPSETDEIYAGDGDYEGPHCKLNYGMERVIEPLYRQVEDHVFLNEQVVKVVRRGENDLCITTSSGMVIEASCCISTVPVGCLQKHCSSIFEPELGQDTKEAIDAMAPGFYKKVFLTFDEIFWSVKEPLMGLVRSKELDKDFGEQLLVYNFWAKNSLPCLEAVLCADSGKWAVGRSDEEIRNAVLMFIQESLGVKNLHERCVSCHVTRWEEDPFTCGAFSTACVGTLEKHVDILQQPHWGGNLIISGEFTEPVHQGSVQGALMSGNRAAEQAFDCLLNRSKRERGALAPWVLEDGGATLVALHSTHGNNRDQGKLLTTYL